MEELKNWEMCMACGCTTNSEEQDFCGECGMEILED